MWAQWRRWNSLEMNHWMCLWRIREAFCMSFLWTECFIYIASFPRAFEYVFHISFSPLASSQMKERCFYPWNVYLSPSFWLSWELLLSFCSPFYFQWEEFLTLPFYLCKVAGFYYCLSQVQHSQSIFFFPLFPFWYPIVCDDLLIVNVTLVSTSQTHAYLQQREDSPNADLAIWYHAPKCFRRLSDANFLPRLPWSQFL